MRIHVRSLLLFAHDKLAFVQPEYLRWRIGTNAACEEGIVIYVDAIVFEVNFYLRST